MEVHDGDVYLSAIELEREHGVVTMPYTPVLRAAAPAREANGTRFGIVVITVDLSQAFARIRSAAQVTR